MAHHPTLAEDLDLADEILARPHGGDGDGRHHLVHIPHRLLKRFVVHLRRVQEQEQALHATMVTLEDTADRLARAQATFADHIVKMKTALVQLQRQRDEEDHR